MVQMGSKFKQGMFEGVVGTSIGVWMEGAKSTRGSQADKMEKELGLVQTAHQTKVATEGTTASITEITCADQPPLSSS